MRIEAFVLGLFVFGSIIIGMYAIFDETADQYGMDTGQDLSAYNKTAESISNINQSFTDLTTGTLSPTSFLGGLGLVFSVVQLVIATPFTIATGMIAHLSTALALPVWFTALISGALVVLVVFGLIALILRFRG